MQRNGNREPGRKGEQSRKREPNAGSRSDRGAVVAAGAWSGAGSGSVSGAGTMRVGYHLRGQLFAAGAWLGRVLSSVSSRLWSSIEPRLRQHRRRSLPRLAVVERLAVGPKQSLLLLEVDGARMLLAQSGESTPAMIVLPIASREAVAPSKARQASEAHRSSEAHQVAESGQAKVGGEKPARRRPVPALPRAQTVPVSTGRIQ